MMSKQDNRQSEKNQNYDDTTIAGDVHISDGDFVGRDKIIYTTTVEKPDLQPISPKHRVQIIIALIAFVGVIITAIAPLIFGGTKSNSTATPTSFTYQVSVQTLTNDPISGANIILELANGKAPLNDFSDSTGLARIFIDTAYVEQPGRVIVKATGYKTYILNIDLTAKDLPKVIQLTPAE